MMCEFHESTCNGFGYIWWTDKPIYFSSIDVSNIEVYYDIQHLTYFNQLHLEMVPPGRRNRANQRWMDCVNRDMRATETTTYEVHGRTGWKRIVSGAATSQPNGSG